MKSPAIWNGFLLIRSGVLIKAKNHFQSDKCAIHVMRSHSNLSPSRPECVFPQSSACSPSSPWHRWPLSSSRIGEPVTIAILARNSPAFLAASTAPTTWGHGGTRWEAAVARVRGPALCTWTMLQTDASSGTEPCGDSGEFDTKSGQRKGTFLALSRDLKFFYSFLLKNFCLLNASWKFL